jgi:hypothetical protein
LAEQELLKCAKMIEEATASLAFSLPNKKPNISKDIINNMSDINAMIIGIISIYYK